MSPTSNPTFGGLEPAKIPPTLPPRRSFGFELKMEDDVNIGAADVVVREVGDAGFVGKPDGDGDDVN